LTDNLNVRKAASASSASLGQVDRGVSMAYLGKEGSFYKTYYKNTVAYVSAKAAYTATYETLSASEKIEKIVEEGTKLIGTPYVYGAVRYHDGNGNTNSSFTVAKFDCSSLTQYIFYKGASKLLQVTTRTQIYQGTHVEKSDLQRGDLIFFTNSSRYNNKGIERVGHVALYLGDNRILHTASDYCKIEEISATRWSYYIEARRMV
jgi:cell wall-associated NlpC family hydrolase